MAAIPADLNMPRMSGFEWKDPANLLRVLQ
jgi:hypothetical protein